MTTTQKKSTKPTHPYVTQEIHIHTHNLHNIAIRQHVRGPLEASTPITIRIVPRHPIYYRWWWLGEFGTFRVKKYLVFVLQCLIKMIDSTIGRMYVRVQY